MRAAIAAQGILSVTAVYEGGLLQGGWEAAGPAPGCFSQLWSNKNQTVVAKGTQRFPSQVPEVVVAVSCWGLLGWGI